MSQWVSSSSHRFSPFCIHLLPSRHLSLVQRLNFCPLASFIAFPRFIFSLLPFFILFLLYPVSVHLTASALVCCRFAISVLCSPLENLHRCHLVHFSLSRQPLRPSFSSSAPSRKSIGGEDLRSDENKESYFQLKRSLILLTMPKQNRKGETEATAQSPALFLLLLRKLC